MFGAHTAGYLGLDADDSASIETGATVIVCLDGDWDKDRGMDWDKRKGYGIGMLVFISLFLCSFSIIQTWDML
jgi:hypothetical protein